MEVFSSAIIEEEIVVPFVCLNKKLDDYFLEYSRKYIEGKCRKEGYIRPNSVTILNITSGLLKENDVTYKVTFKVDACFPDKGMLINAKIKNITKIGIRAVVSDVDNPIILFVSGEHNPHKNMESYIIGQRILLKVIDYRFELYDDFISVIAEIV